MAAAEARSLVSWDQCGGQGDGHLSSNLCSSADSIRSASDEDDRPAQHLVQSGDAAKPFVHWTEAGPCPREYPVRYWRKKEMLDLKGRVIEQRLEAPQGQPVQIARDRAMVCRPPDNAERFVGGFIAREKVVVQAGGPRAEGRQVLQPWNGDRSVQVMRLEHAD